VADKSNTTIAELIRASMRVLTRAERQLANALMANYPVAGLTSITELAKTANVSTPTVLRMAKKIGFSGFPEFQSALRRELEATLSNPIAKHDRWAIDVPEGHILNRFASATIDNLQTSLQHIDYKMFDKVSSLLADHDSSVHIVGGRITHAIADYLFTHLQVIRKDVHMLPASSGLWPHHLLNMNKGDVLVVFDIRRYEADLVKLAELAQERGTRVVLFTDQWMSPISTSAVHSFNLRIEVPSGWDSAVATLFMVEALIASVENNLWPQTSSRMSELEALFDATKRFRKSP
jgi:DNA-binding MurR/RpiR family transcriptional regulator